jgi:hypothetical protein
MAGCPENIQMMTDESARTSWLLEYIAKPMWYSPATNSLQVTFPSAQSVSISGTPAVSQSGTWNIGTLTSMTQKDGIPLGQSEIKWAMDTRWANCMRGRIS